MKIQILTVLTMIAFATPNLGCATGSAAMGIATKVGSTAVSLVPILVQGVGVIANAVKKDAVDTTDATLSAVGFGGDSDAATDDGE